jgi:hypothetical protein
MMEANKQGGTLALAGVFSSARVKGRRALESLCVLEVRRQWGRRKDEEEARRYRNC